MVRSEAGMQRTRTAILDAATRLLSRRPDAAIAEIAEEAGVGRATLYRHFPTRESLRQGVGEAGIAEIAKAFEAAALDDLPADRAIARITAVVMRNGAQYAAVISQVDATHSDPADIDRVTRPLREVVDRAVRDGVLRDDLRGEAVFEMFTAILERALYLTIGDRMTPEEATEAALAIFLDGARKPA
ncbi:TetR/AcrR family transcriptional regulator [Lentzea sp. NPDC059081]|uniref:TetR/AcrR family transcriptional regulator n=1 Tax=Lentzea sp. NPDC059081 TaxID=3346719 RepID=UPI0036A9BD5B